MNRGNRVILAHGARNPHRDRQVIVEPWAWAIHETYLRAGRFLPDVLTFPVSEREHRRAHAAVIGELAADGRTVPSGYTLHTARHSYAVEMMKQGRDPVLVENSLGHADTRLALTLYGQVPASADGSAACGCARDESSVTPQPSATGSAVMEIVRPLVGSSGI